MHSIKNQILAGTRLDSHGERNQRDWLQRFADMYSGKRMPLNQQHDLSLQSPGYAENLQVVPDQSSPGDWNLVGDVYYSGERLELPAGGFSISFLEVLRRSKTQDQFHVYLPYPHYNDTALIEEVFAEGFVSVGRWAKKAADPNTIALVGTVVVAVFAPVWDDTYKSRVAPLISRFFQERFGSLRSRGIHADFIQYITYEGNEVQALLIPSRGRENHCFAIEKTTAAMFKIHDYLIGLEINHVPVAKIFMRFDDAADQFVFLRIEFTDGSTTRDA
jgi:hypothetical protein